MIWLILAILLIGYYIVKAINRNTVNNALIAQQQYLNSHEYRKQAQASMAYWYYIQSALDHKIMIAEAKIELLNPPSHYEGFEFDAKTGKFDIVVTNGKSEVVRRLKTRLRGYEHTLSELKNEYEKGKAEYVGYYPESLEEMKDKYELAVPFPPDIDEAKGHYYFNEDNASSWSMYEEQKVKLERLTHQLASLEQRHREPKRLI